MAGLWNVLIKVSMDFPSLYLCDIWDIHGCGYGNYDALQPCTVIRDEAAI
jgi:hypothetical protein